MKKCVSCEKSKPLEAFNWADQRGGQRQNRCRDCRNYAKNNGIQHDRSRWDEKWIPVCERCPLEDCVTGTAEAALKCPAEIAEHFGWTPDEAERRADDLGLIEPVQWMPI